MARKRRGRKVGSSWYTYRKINGKRRRVKVTKKPKGKYKVKIVKSRR